MTLLPRAGANDKLQSYPVTLVISTVAPVVIVVVVLCVARIAVFEADRARSRRQAMLGLVITVYLFLPPICTLIFSGVPCACVALGLHLVASRPVPVARR